MANPVVVEKYFRQPDHPAENADKRVRKHLYWCPGCDALHGVVINPDKNTLGAGWDFSGTLECPTYAPSQLTRYETGAGQYVCHTFIRNGMIEYLPDSTHSMAGRTVPMVPLPDWVTTS